MTTLDRIKELAKKRNKNLKQVAIDLNFSENYFYTLKKQDPSGSNLLKVAEYFNVSTDYILGRTDIPTVLSDDALSIYENRIKQLHVDSDDIRRKLNSPSYNEKLKKRVQVLNEIITLFDLPNSEETKQEILFFLLELKNRTK